MAAETKAATVAPLPTRGEIVSTGALLSTQIANYRSSLGFGGTRSPSAIGGWFGSNSTPSTRF